MTMNRVTQSLARVPMPVWYVLAGGVGLFLAYRAIKGTAGLVGQGVKSAVNAVGGALDDGLINPASPNNALYRGVNQDLKWFGLIDKDQTLGTAIYDWLHPNQIDPTAPVTAQIGYVKSGDVWYGYNRAAADEAARQAANSQIAKDVATYGGGYGSLTK